MVAFSFNCVYTELCHLLQTSQFHYDHGVERMVIANLVLRETSYFLYFHMHAFVFPPHI